MKILLADDDLDLTELLSDYLLQEGFLVDSVHNGEDALKRIQQNDIDLLVLDVMMPLKNGFDVLTTLRKDHALPVIMLTAKGDKVDRILGLEMGADDYVAKPCDPRELVARIRAVTRRFEKTQGPISQSETISLSDLHLSRVTREVSVNNTPIDLTATEFDLLDRLVSASGQVVSKEELSQKCLGKRLQPHDRSIDMHMSNLRKKLGKYSNGKDRIKTLLSVGYQYLEAIN